MGGQRQVAEGERVDALVDELGDALEVAGRLGHLAAAHQQMLAVDPVACRDLARDGDRLGDLVLVVGEDVIDAAGVDLELVAQVPASHRRALEVPAREALAPLRRPLQLPALAGGFPEREVGRVALARLDLDAMPCPQLIEGVARQAPIVGKAGDLVVERAVGCQVGVAKILQARGERQHLRDVLGRAREDVGWEEVDQRRVGMEAGLVGIGDLGRRLVLELRRHQHPVGAAVEALVAQVADVGDVLDVEDVQAVVEQRPPDEVGQQEGAQVADVGPAIDGRAAGVEADPLAPGSASGRLERRGPARSAGSACCAGEGSSELGVRSFRSRCREADDDARLVADL